MQANEDLVVLNLGDIGFLCFWIVTVHAEGICGYFQINFLLRGVPLIIILIFARDVSKHFPWEVTCPWAAHIGLF